MATCPFATRYGTLDLVPTENSIRTGAAQRIRLGRPECPTLYSSLLCDATDPVHSARVPRPRHRAWGEAFRRIVFEYAPYSDEASRHHARAVTRRAPSGSARSASNPRSAAIPISCRCLRLLAVHARERRSTASHACLAEFDPIQLCLPAWAGPGRQHRTWGSVPDDRRDRRHGRIRCKGPDQPARQDVVHHRKRGSAVRPMR
jgi:hypothetical protein